MRLVRTTLIPAIFAILSGCGGQPQPVPGVPGPGNDPNPDNSFEGTVGGKQFVVKEAIIVPVSGGGSLAGATVFLSSVPGICNVLRANSLPASATLVVFTLHERSAAGLVTGNPRATYSVTQNAVPGDGRWGYPAFSTIDANCSLTSQNLGTSGFVELETYDQSGKVSSGHFDVHWGTDRTDGKFKASFCEIPGATGSPTCSHQ